MNKIKYFKRNKKIIFGIISALIVCAVIVFTFVYSFTFPNKSIEINNDENFNNECMKSITAGYNNKDANTSHYNNNYLLNSNCSYESYIGSNASSKFTNSEKITPATVMILKQTLADSEKIDNITTLDELHYLGSSEAEIAMYDNYCVLYNLDDNSDYYVGYVNTIEGRVLDTIFAKNNYKGQTLCDCSYDKNTGLIYIPKYYSKGVGQGGKESVLETQMQMLIAVDPDKDKKVSTKIDITLNRQNSNSVHTTINANALDTSITVPVGDISSKNISVVANDRIDLTSKSVLNNGYLYVGVSPTNIANLKIGAETSNPITYITSIFKEDNVSTSLDDIPCLPYTLNKDFHATSGGTMSYVGAKYNSIQTVVYAETPSSAPYQEYLYGVGGFTTDAQINTFADQIWNDSGAVDLSNLSVVSNRTYNLFTNYQNDIFLEDFGHGLALKCGHIGTPAAHDFDNKEVRVKILAINENLNYAILGFTTAVAGYTHQGGCGIYKVKYESKGGCQMTKNTTCAWSKTISNYSLKGAKYDIYTDVACTNYTGVSIILDANGNGHTGTNVLDSKKTYYVRESSTDTGTNYLHNRTVGSVYIANTNSYNNTVNWDTGTVTFDIPASESAPVRIVKADNNTGEEGTTQGSASSFENANYEFKYYTDYFKNANEEAEHQSSYQRHWVMSTDINGQVAIDESFKNRKISGDDFYVNQDGLVTNPLGTYVICETKAPEGYLLSDKPYILQVVPDALSPCGAKEIYYDGLTGEELPTIIDKHTGDKVTKAFEQVIKADLEFDKQDNHANRLAKIPFKITSTTTGEWHVVVTDLSADVNSSSAWCPHTKQTNYFDLLLNNDGSIPSSGIDENVIDEFYKISGNRSGVWFCWDKEKECYVAPNAEKGDDKLGALPYDTYILEELPVVRNKDYLLINQEFSVNTANTLVNLGTLINYDKTTASIRTFATNKSGEKDLPISDNVLVNDRVEYSGLDANRYYYLKSWLVDKSSGVIISDVFKTTFRTIDAVGYEDVQLIIDARQYAGREIVVYEELYNEDNILVSFHRDRYDSNQTLSVQKPSLSTFLHAEGAYVQTIERSHNCKIIDKISYNGLENDVTYTVKSKLVNIDGSDFVDEAGNLIYVENDYKADDSGFWEVEFNVDTYNLEDGKKLVAFEEVLLNGEVVCSHLNINDNNQTVIVSTNDISLLTNSRGRISNDKNLYCVSDEGIIDAVNYSGAEPGFEYVLRGRLIDRITGEVISPKNAVIGCDYIEKPFISNQSGIGSVDMIFEVDTRLLQSRDIVCFEELYDHTGAMRSCHDDITDYYQTTTTNQPKIETDLYQKTKESRNIHRYVNQCLIDKISFQQFCAGKKYFIKGILIDKNSGKEYINEITHTFVEASCSFIPESDSGTLTKLEYNFDSTLMPKDMQLVSFIEVYQDDVKILEHKNLDDERQTVTVLTPQISTNLYDAITSEKWFIAQNKKTISDDITWQNLPEERNVQMFTWLVNSETGVPISDGDLSDDEAKNLQEDFIIALGGTVYEEELSAYEEESKTRLIVSFDKLTNKIDYEKLSELNKEKLSHIALFLNDILINGERGTSTVSGEFNFGKVKAQKATALTVIVSENTVVATHTNLNDKDETIEIIRSEIQTLLSDANGNKDVDLKEKLILTDRISYKNLIVDKKYVVQGKLVNKNTEEEISTNSIKFKPEEPDGEFNVSFELNNDNLYGCDIVAYEYLYLEGDLACAHEDISSSSQTVHVNEKAPNILSRLAKTGDKYGLFIFAALIVLLVVVLYFQFRTRISNLLRINWPWKNAPEYKVSKNVKYPDLFNEIFN